MTYDELLIKHEDDVDVFEHDLQENPIAKKANGKGFYYNGTILIQEGLTDIDKKCVLAEELGHHYTSSGNILNMKYPNTQKQELHARVWGAIRLINFEDFLRALYTYEFNLFMVADELGVNYETIKLYRNYLFAHGVISLDDLLKYDHNKDLLKTKPFQFQTKRMS